MAHSFRRSTTDQRYARFTAWPNQYNLVPTGMSTLAVQAFDSVNEFYGVESFEYTKIYKLARDRGLEDARDEFKCFLDYVYPWLIEGDATVVCPTFDAYLLAVIGMIELERYQVGVQGIERSFEVASEDDDGSDGFDIFYWGRRPSKEMPSPVDEKTFGFHRTTPPHEDVAHPWTERDMSLSNYAGPLPFDWGGLEHPALLKKVYKDARRRTRKKNKKKDRQDL